MRTAISPRRQEVIRNVTVTGLPTLPDASLGVPTSW
jgi:hypothetical protein